MAGVKAKAVKKADSKFYAVRKGKVPGVYMTWEDCQENTVGFKGAMYKSFHTEAEATAWASGKEVKSSDPSAPQKFYGVAVGHVPGVYTEWSEAQEQIQGVKGPKYKKFETKVEAEAFVKSGNDAFTAAAPGTKRKAEHDDDADSPVSKKSKSSVKPNGPVGNVNVFAMGAKDPKKPGFLQIYTDGSALGNGKKGSIAGVGVFFGPNDKRNVSEALATTSEEQTNQRAELTAAKRALEITPLNKSVQIYTDSKYTIDCVTNWYKGWEKRARDAEKKSGKKEEWMNAQGQPVKNSDLIRAIRAKMEEREKKGAETDFVWVKGHAGDPNHTGNDAADRLAVAGAQKALAERTASAVSKKK